MNKIRRREQRRTFFGSIEYVLHVTIVCLPEELEIISEHGLDRNQLFAVPEVETHQQLSQTAFERADGRSLLRSKDASKLLVDIIAGVVHATRAKLAYVVTVADALDGTTITCSNLRELVSCEEQITTAFDELSLDVENALAFAIGREEVLAPDNAPEPGGLPPAAWGDRQQWWRAR